MTASPTQPQRFPPTIVALHWLTLLLAIAVVLLIELKGMFPRGSAPRTAMANWHYTLGITILVVTAIRLVVRLGITRPPIVPEPPALQEKLAILMDMALYLLLFGLPILGWLTLSAKDRAVWFWGVTLPMPLAPDKALGDQLKEVHEALANVAIWLVGIHAAAALYHRYFLHDNTLARMLPGGVGKG